MDRLARGGFKEWPLGQWTHKLVCCMHTQCVVLGTAVLGVKQSVRLCCTALHVYQVQVTDTTATVGNLIHMHAQPARSAAFDRPV